MNSHRGFFSQKILEKIKTSDRASLIVSLKKNEYRSIDENSKRSVGKISKILKKNRDGSQAKRFGNFFHFFFVFI